MRPVAWTPRKSPRREEPIRPPRAAVGCAREFNGVFETGWIMEHRSNMWLRALCAVVAGAVVGCGGGNGDGGNGGGNAARLAQSHSTTLALSNDNAYVWSVNPDSDSVSLLEVAGDRNR